MERKRRRIVLYGNSVILGTIGTSLRRSARFDVSTLPKPAQQELKALNPDVVLFDLEAAHAEPAFSLLESRPGLLLIGISSDTNLVKVWSGQQLRELSTGDLLRIIDANALDSAAMNNTQKKET